MPRFVRNFWLEGRVDRRRTFIKGGPRTKNGGMEFTLFQRHKGAPVPVLDVFCAYRQDGRLVTTINICDVDGKPLRVQILSDRE